MYIITITPLKPKNPNSLSFLCRHSPRLRHLRPTSFLHSPSLSFPSSFFLLHILISIFFVFFFFFSLRFLSPSTEPRQHAVHCSAAAAARLPTAFFSGNQSDFKSCQTRSI